MEIWQEIAFRGLREVRDPLGRVQRLIEQDLGEYVGGRVFEGGCFFLNLLVELSGQEPAMTARILKGFDAFAKRLEGWFAEAAQMGLLRPEADPKEMAEFLVTALNGAAALFAARPEPAATERTLRHPEHYVDSWRA